MTADAKMRLNSSEVSDGAGEKAGGVQPMLLQQRKRSILANVLKLRCCGTTRAARGSVCLDTHPVSGIASMVDVLIGAHILGVGEARIFRRTFGAGAGRQALHRPIDAAIEKEGNGITLPA